MQLFCTFKITCPDLPFGPEDILAFVRPECEKIRKQLVETYPGIEVEFDIQGSGKIAPLFPLHRSYTP